MDIHNSLSRSSCVSVRMYPLIFNHAICRSVLKKIMQFTNHFSFKSRLIGFFWYLEFYMATDLSKQLFFIWIVFNYYFTLFFIIYKVYYFYLSCFNSVVYSKSTAVLSTPKLNFDTGAVYFHAHRFIRRIKWHHTCVI